MVVAILKDWRSTRFTRVFGWAGLVFKTISTVLEKEHVLLEIPGLLEAKKCVRYQYFKDNQDNTISRKPARR